METLLYGMPYDGIGRSCGSDMRYSWQAGKRKPYGTYFLQYPVFGNLYSWNGNLPFEEGMVS